MTSPATHPSAVEGDVDDSGETAILAGLAPARGIPLEAWVALAIMAGVLALAFVSVLRATGGAFGYMLDDPYIHLSMAEQILRGQYGINPGEPAAASSSILYPYLLAGLMAVGADLYAPLIVNVAALAGLLVAVALILREIAGAPRPGHVANRAILVAAIGIGVNGIALVFSGMENGVHMALTVAGLLGVLMLLRTGRPPLWWLAVLFVTPLIRYEGVGLLLAGALVLALNGHRNTALSLTAVTLACMAAFSLYLNALGLPYLPSSVLVKSEEAMQGAGPIGGLLRNVAFNLSHRDGIVLLALIAFVGWSGIRAARRRDGWRCLGVQVALFGLIGMGGQLLLGRFHAFNRYSAYALALGLLCAIVVETNITRRVLHRGGAALTGAALLALAFLFPASIALGLMVGSFSANIHAQQYQTHRFATEFWKAPIAVNDIGWPSYKNENYVLDLWGLGSERARQMRRLANPAEGLAALAEEKNVHVAAIYENWFTARPPAWVPVGRMKLDIPQVSADTDTVTFYATRSAYVPAVREALTAFGRTLPQSASLTID